MFSLEKCLLRSSAQFQLCYFGFLLSCMYILEMEPLWTASFTNIFSHFIGRLVNFGWFPLLCRTCKFV